jgi:hypothetical protein
MDHSTIIGARFVVAVVSMVVSFTGQPYAMNSSVGYILP